MPVRPVVRLPEAVLRSQARSVDVIDWAARALAQDLVDTMYVSPGCVGLAAPQIDVPLRALCIDVTGHKKAQTCHGLVVMFNPVIVVAEAPETGREGCMSVPDLTGDVPRATRVVVCGLGVDGSELVIETDAFEAKAVQHEVDHLNGLLFLDRVESSQGIFPRKIYR